MVGLLFFALFSMLGIKVVGIILLAICAIIGYAVGAFKIPTIAGIPVTKRIGGEPVSEIIMRYIKFKKNRKMYIYTTKEEK